MNVPLNTITAATGIVVGACGVIYTFLNKDRYKTQVNDIWKPGNDELRAQIAAIREENRILVADNSNMDSKIQNDKILITKLEELNSKQPDFTSLLTVMSNNHKEVMLKVSEVLKINSERV